MSLYRIFHLLCRHTMTAYCEINLPYYTLLMMQSTTFLYHVDPNSKITYIVYEIILRKICIIRMFYFHPHISCLISSSYILWLEVSRNIEVARIHRTHTLHHSFYKVFYQVLGIESRLRHAVLYNNKSYQKRFHLTSYFSTV